ncbi:hypothetical protein TARUN_7151 [Trichoderma arundinaceum]|uniref:Uncharacterized protein n=1 Tax=Trichoderma arundinaceum TaxID=490622 RepID=A0A395NG56_TRIAR|nr:hypothetical protein TARUN_7151 [Trichoderma arundinaceum]
MAANRDIIDLRVPFIDGDDANKKNDKQPLAEDRVGIWGGNGSGEGDFEIVIVEMDSNCECYAPREKLLITRKFTAAYYSHPTFIHIRTKWPAQLYALPNHVIEDDDFKRVKHHYGATPKHDGGHKDDAWWAYLEDTHNFLIRLQDCQAPNGIELMSILRGQTQDLADLFYVPSHPFVISPEKEVILGIRAQALHRDGKYVSFSFCEDALSDLLRAWFGRRFLASMVEVGRGTGQWVSIIFDRLRDPDTEKIPHLYILDPGTAGRSERADYIIHMWRQVLREIGYPTHFVAHVLPLSNRPQEWTTPYIALFSSMQAIRGLAGNRTLDLARREGVSLRVRNFLKVSPDDPRPNDNPELLRDYWWCAGGNSDLRFRDWCIEIKWKSNKVDIRSSLSWVLTHLVGCATLELGIQKYTSFSETRLRQLFFDLGPLATNDWSTLFACRKTIFGGFNPIIPNLAKYKRFKVTGDIQLPTLKDFNHLKAHINPMRRRMVTIPRPQDSECEPKIMLIQQSDSR